MIEAGLPLSSMTPLHWLGLVVALILFVYLFVAMLKPESMQ